MFVKYLISALFFVYANCAFSQPRHLSTCRGLPCQPNVEVNGRDILDPELTSPPFNKILHLGVKTKHDDIEHYSTVSFVGKELLLAARHALDKNDEIEYIELSLASKVPERWIKLYPSDFKIFYYAKEFSSLENDLAIIKILKTNVSKIIYKGNFNLMQFDTLKTIAGSDTIRIHLTGFPCSKFSLTYGPDTLVSRSTTVKECVIDESNHFLYFPLFVCPGDSGSPIWVKFYNSYFIIALLQGSRPDRSGKINPAFNEAVILNSSIMSWLKSFN